MNCGGGHDPLLALVVDELHQLSAVMCVLAYRVTALEALALKRGLATPEEMVSYRRAVVDRQTDILLRGSGLDDVEGPPR